MIKNKSLGAKIGENWREIKKMSAECGVRAQQQPGKDDITSAGMAAAGKLDIMIAPAGRITPDLVQWIITDEKVCGMFSLRFYHKN